MHVHGSSNDIFGRNLPLLCWEESGVIVVGRMRIIGRCSLGWEWEERWDDRWADVDVVLGGSGNFFPRDSCSQLHVASPRRDSIDSICNSLKRRKKKKVRSRVDRCVFATYMDNFRHNRSNHCPMIHWMWCCAWNVVCRIARVEWERLRPTNTHRLNRSCSPMER